ncbi:MAG: ABC transporter ATP-binding protein [Blastocatellales bacterium]
MIRVEHLTRTFGEHTAVNDLSFEIRQGETFALLGPNGSGKTTTLKCMAGLIEPTRGKILIDGFDAWKNPRQARSRMSYLPQRVNFPDNLTARESLEFYCRLRKLPLRRVDETLKGARFNFNGFTDKPVGKFSGGMIQRLGLAVACLPDAPILLLDEPTVSLDPEGAIRFREFLLSLKGEGKTIVFTSHVLADVEQLADRVAILAGGRLVALESIEALREGLMRGSRMRVALSNRNGPDAPDNRWIETAMRAGASEAVWSGGALVIASSSEDRLAILESLQRAGAGIASFVTQEQSLEDIYLRYINGQNLNIENSK